MVCVGACERATCELGRARTGFEGCGRGSWVEKGKGFEGLRWRWRAGVPGDPEALSGVRAPEEVTTDGRRRIHKRLSKAAALERVGKSGRPTGGGGRSDRVGERFGASNFKKGRVRFAFGRGQPGQGRQECSSRSRWCEGKGGRQERSGWLGVKGRQGCSGAVFLRRGGFAIWPRAWAGAFYRVGKKDEVAWRVRKGARGSKSLG